jgi:cysteinyl-tRNA synthetase
MSTQCLGDYFDIHGGGQDLQFPHHENEIAQSVGATGEPFVNVWIHNGFVRVDEEKMSKSLGNFFTVREVLEQFQPEVIRFFILSSHYRSPLNYSQDHLGEAQAALDRLYTALRDVPVSNASPDSQYVERFNDVMDDDFNTPKAVALMHELAREINRLDDKTTERVQCLAATLRHLGGILGLLQDSPQAYLQGSVQTEGGITNDEIQVLIEQRNEARTTRNFAEADRIRDQLSKNSITLEDTPDGTIWRRN